jgi:hypothetical protein
MRKIREALRLCLAAERRQITVLDVEGLRGRAS